MLGTITFHGKFRSLRFGEIGESLSHTTVVKIYYNNKAFIKLIFNYIKINLFEYYTISMF